MTETFTFVRIADTETTGFPPDAEMVEIGWTDLRYYPTGWVIESDGQSRFVNPGRPIPPGASKIHGITDDMVVAGMDPNEARAFIATGPDMLCAHNAAFDRQFLRGHTLPWLCTLQCSRQAFPGLPNYKNETIRQELGLSVSGDAHRAGYDSAVTARIFLEIVKVMSIEKMLKASSPSYQPLRMPFGAHAGKLFTEIPEQYLNFIITKSDMAPGIKEAARIAKQKLVGTKAPEPDPDAWRSQMGSF
ncbi:exonuclease domain-containing protein [Mesorhizobium sp. ANAO-SY3R2]|uniref:3'-5' exonuclease n=1 Tax=Mesorhizobium sp. ANAO-SY3R2 TaxID=3166644 RepID=UPI0036727A78